MKKRHIVSAALLICSLTFLLSFQALNSYADTVHAYVYTDPGNSGYPASPPMFSGPATSNMVPGDTVEGELEIRNNMEGSVDVVNLSASLTSDPLAAGNFPKSLQLVVSQGTFAADEIYSGTLADFMTPNTIHIKEPLSVPGKSTVTLNYKVAFLPESGNETQGKSCTVDFIVDFASAETGGGDTNYDGDGSINNADTSASQTVVETTPTGSAPVEQDAPVLAPVPPQVEPEQGIINPASMLPETGWAGMAGGGAAALMMAGAGLTLRHLSRRRWK